MSTKGKILVAPLDWGLGHAARCVRIVNELLKEHDVILAGSGRVKHFLSGSFPELEFIDFRGYNIEYPDKGSMALKMMLQMPKVLTRIKEENRELDKLIQKYSVDLVISDNRFGLYSDKVPCIYITHQIHIQAPGMVGERLFKLHKKYIDKFDECWIPDVAQAPGLAGDLSHGRMPSNRNYIGPLSRMVGTTAEKKYDYCALISGPEPQRSHFETLLRKAFTNREDRVLLICGKPETRQTTTNENVRTVSYLDGEDLSAAIAASHTVISRPGYSSIMDLATVQANCIFIPTPGQTEQEYLAKLHEKVNGVPFMYQKEISYERLKKLEAQPIKLPAEPHFNFNQAIRELLENRST